MTNSAGGILERVIKRLAPGYWRERRETEQIRAWIEAGKPSRPPHAVKSRAVKEYAAKFAARTLIETGTYQGAMVLSCKNAFARIYSVELSASLFAKAKELFASASNVTLLQGDSATVLPRLLAEIGEPCIFWLDAHYSGGDTAQSQVMTPIFEELETIFGHRVTRHVILIDDAGDFVGSEGYPTIAELRAFVLVRRPNWTFEVRDDIVRIHP